MGLTFTFIANACGVFTGDDGTRLLMDPWLVDGVFEGSWCHYPPLSTHIEDLQDVDAIYVSHIHPDHFDSRFFDFRRDMPIVVLERKNNFLQKRIEGMGYTNVQAVADGATTTIGALEITLFKPFTTHNFHDATVGNVIDSAIVIASDGVHALNANDNTPTPEACRMLRERFGRFDLAMLNYNAAGPYPACFLNLSEAERYAEHDRILQRNMDYMIDLLRVLEPAACLPFAGAYVLGGSQRHKNPYLGTTTWDACAEYLRAHGAPCELVTLREGTTYDVGARNADRAYEPLDPDDCAEYIERELAGVVYDYETDPQPDRAELLRDLEVAAAQLQTRAARFGLATTFQVSVAYDGLRAQVLPEFAVDATPGERSLSCTLDARLLRRILDRKAQWNSAEIGCHSDFVRTPNEYEPDLHTMLQFLHR
ncbi:MAG: MBL fold metallo-hydrolase [Acidimicrobiia bacterium]